MKTLRTIVLLAVVSMMLVSVANAQSPKIGVYFGPDQVSSTNVVPNNTFKIWVKLAEITGDVNAVEYKLTLPAGVIVLDYTYYGDDPIVFGSAAEGVAVGFGECAPMFPGNPEFETLLVAELTAMSLTTFSATPVTITRFEGNPQSPSTAPRFSDCDGVLFDLAVENGTLLASVGVESTSFGAVKALY